MGIYFFAYDYILQKLLLQLKSEVKDMMSSFNIVDKKINYLLI
jgi:hypothetical protein